MRSVFISSYLWGVAFLAVFLGSAPASAQELDCAVQIDDSQLKEQSSELSFLDDLERKMQEYLNTRSWTDDRFLRHERISCSLQIILEEVINLSEFQGRLIVTIRRPIYGTSQSSLVARINDSKWRFEHDRGTSLEHNLDRYDSLTSVLDFYAFLILGYDYDTFSSLGGTPHFEKARSVADRAESSGDPGWSSVGTSRNRAQLISELLGQRHEPLREVYYQYHRKGLDRFVDETEQARKSVLETLNTLQKLNRQTSRSFALNVFFQTKSDELTALFAGSSLASQAHGLLVQMNPSQSSKYNQLIE